MKIGLVINSLEGGGAEKVVSILANSLHCCGDQVTIFLLGNNKPIYEVDSRIEIVHLSRLDDYRKSSLRKLADFAVLPFRLSRALKERGIGVVVSSMFRSNIINILSGIMNRHKTVICEHSILSKEHKGNVINGIFVKTLYPQANRIISVSNAVKQDLCENFGVEQKDVKTIYNPIDIDGVAALSREDIDSETKNFVSGFFTMSFCGRLIENKNVQLVLEAMRRLRDEGIEIRLLIIGSGTYENNLKDRVRELGLADSVLFLGWQKNPYKYIAVTNLFILPSLWESFGNVVIESYSCGVSVLTSDAYALKELSEGGTISSVFKSGNLDDMVREIKILMSEQTINHDPVKIEKFRLSNILEQYRAIIREV